MYVGNTTNLREISFFLLIFQVICQLLEIIVLSVIGIIYTQHSQFSYDTVFLWKHVVFY